MDFSKWNVFWSLCFGLLSFLIIVGNALSISILFKRKLRKRPHYLLISLAFADLLVGLIPVPLYIIIQYSRYRIFGLVYTRGDMFAGLSSVFTLAAISLERLHAIARPLRHRQLTLRSYAISIATPWILSLIVTFVPVFPFITHIQASSVIIISLSTPLLITCISYCIIWRKQSSRIPNETQARKNVHLNKTLLLITTIFVLSWLPFQVLAAVLNFCISCRRLNKTLIILLYVIKLLHYSNSFMNFLVYCFRMSDYRKALSRMFPQMQMQPLKSRRVLVLSAGPH
ncbi:adenosine receptor A1-like [Porites lutea]|uniref:adenosine receptor A1-like n=1 Tax=Porites lutea TaxID=51062 RepID=UPI003CC5E691